VYTYLNRFKSNWYLIVIVILVALLAFGIGRLSVLYGKASDFKILYPTSEIVEHGEVLGASNTTNLTTNNSLSSGPYVASKTGSKYHLPWCAGAQAIKEENKIYFSTKDEAEARGYEPAGNCKGI